MTNQLLTQCGSQRCSLEQLLTIQDPPKTKTYTPLGHYDFAVNVLTIASEILKGYRFDGDAYAVNSTGQKITAIYQSQHNFSQLQQDVEAMKSRRMNTRQKYEFVGMLTGEGILSPSQSSAAYKELWKPSHEEFTAPTLWAGYNCVTEALKSTPVHQIVQRHSALHQLTYNLYLN